MQSFGPIQMLSQYAKSFCNITLLRYSDLLSFDDFFGKEKISALFCKNKAADESLPLWASLFFINHFVLNKQRAEFFFYFI